MGMGGGRGSSRKERNLKPVNPFVPLGAVQGRQWGRGKAQWGLDMEPPGADVLASLKMSSSAWICLRLSPVAQTGAYPYTG